MTAQNAQSLTDRSLEKDEMNWEAYATHYDELCALNPAYHDNIAMLLDRLPSWNLPSQPRVCDLGAGTGNFILSLAEVLPKAEFWHVDFDNRMMQLAQKKYSDRCLQNVAFVQSDVHQVEFPADHFDLVICINALYAFTPQAEILRKVRTWLKPEGKLFIIDFGRKQRTLEWTLYIFRESLKSRQITRYLKGLIEGRQVMKQNRKVTKGQESGRYWLHTTQELGEVLQDCGFEVEELFSCYRGYADLAVCSK